MTDLQIGQRFKSKSKVQTHPVEYIYHGQLPNGQYLIEAASGIEIDNCEVDVIWFDNRKIRKEE